MVVSAVVFAGAITRIVEVYSPVLPPSLYIAVTSLTVVDWKVIKNSTWKPILVPLVAAVRDSVAMALEL